VVDRPLPVTQLGRNTAYWRNNLHGLHFNGESVPVPITNNVSKGYYLKIPKPAYDSVPFDYEQFSKKEIERIISAYRFFDPDTNPIISQVSAIEAHAAVLKATLKFWSALNPRLSWCATLIGEKSIREGPSFADKYATLYKYIRQCIWGVNWYTPTEYPFEPSDCPFKAGSWYKLRKLLSPRGEDITPEIIPPPELLYPWKDFEPTKIKDRYESGNDPTPDKDLDMELIRSIIDECLVPCEVVPTMTDFISSQCDTHKVAKYDNIQTYKDMMYATKTKSQEKTPGDGHEDNRKWTTFKYAKIPGWVENQPIPTEQNMFAIRTPVWKRVSEFRDATTYSVTLLHQIWLFNTVLKYSWSPEIKQSIGDFTTHQSLKDWVGKYCRGDTYTINTDYKSSGLTMPHWFTKEVITILERKNENNNINIMFPSKGWPILDKASGEIYSAKGFGYGLGAINNLYTLFNIVLHKYAIKKELLEESSKILSFNDDSTFTSSTPVLGEWLQLVRHFGGWADASKTVQLKGGTWFCEIHQLRFLAGNYKLISAYHTLVNSILKAVNSDHWRHLVTDIFDSIRGWNHDISPIGAENSKGIIETLAQYVLNFGERFWGKKFDTDCPVPEAGGICLGYGTRTPYAIKGSLVWLERAKEQFSIEDYVKYATTFRASKEYVNRKIQYRPWIEFPEGDTKKTFQFLGKLKGIHYELKQFADKAQNMFNTDSTWFRNEQWLNINDYIDDKLTLHPYKEGFFDWALQQDWPNEAIPQYFVEEEEYLPENYVLPWVELPEVKPKMTITSLVIGYIMGQIPIGKLDFRPYFAHPILIKCNQSEYIPQLTQLELEKVLAHGSPKKMILDYFLRYGSIPIRLKTRSTMSKTCLDLLKVHHKDEIPFIADGATWWTSTPIAYREPWLEEVRFLLPHHQEHMLARIFIHGTGQPGDEYVKYSVKDVIEDKKFNGKFWKEQTTLKKKKEKSKQDSSETITQMFSKVKIKDRKYADIDNIDIIPVLEDLYNKQIVNHTVEVKATIPFNLYESSMVEVLTFEDDPEPEPEDEWWLRDDAPQESEDDLVAQYLNSGEWFSEVQADTGVG
jgi:hypothetical protein